MADADKTATDNTGLLRHITFRSAVALVIANVIGAGVFTTTGFQAADLGHPGWIFVLWAVGGALAYCGALCYSELGAAMPQAGGEYVYLRETYGKAFGFMSAFVSLIAGFSAPVAAGLKALMRYLSAFFPALAEDPYVLGGMLHLNDLLAVILVWFLIGIQFFGARGAITFNNLVTVFKVAGIVCIILAAAAFGNGNIENLSYVSPAYYEMSGNERFAALGTSLIFVMFCYSGWNAAAYVASEIVEPQRNLPRALLFGTVIVTLLYMLLNAVYLYGENVDGLAGTVEVGLVAARSLFGDWGAGLVTVVLVVSLLASCSAMTIAGPRVSYALGKDIRSLKFLARTSGPGGIPSTALILQGLVTTVLIVSGTVDQILQYAGFTLAATSAMAVSCVIVLRFTRVDMSRPFRVTAYPLPPIVYLVITIWTMFWAFQGRPVESSLAMLTVVLGGVFFFVGRKISRSTSG